MLGLRGIRTASPVLLRSSRQIGARRWASGEGGSTFTGAADNAFNRERQAVKDHAGATAGMFMPSSTRNSAELDTRARQIMDVEGLTLMCT